MRALRFAGLASLLLSSLLAIAGCDETPPPTPPSDAGPRDAQTVVPDGGDAGVTPLPDGGDAGELDGGGGFDPGTCRVESPTDDVLVLGTDAPPRARDVGIAAGPTGHAIVWSSGEGALGDVFFAALPPSGAAGAATPVTEHFAVTRDPVIAANGTGWMLAWYGNADGDFDVYAEPWSAAGASAGPAQRLTMRVGRDDAPALLPTTTGALAAWVEERTITSRVAVTRLLGTDAMPSTAQRDSSPASAAVSRPLLAHRSGGFALAWVDSVSPTPSALLQPLGTDGAPMGAPITLSTEGNADGTIDLAMDEGGGAVTFGVSVGGVRPEVRARLVDGSGNPSGPERVITDAPASGRDASIAPLAGGYAIAYRALEGATPQLRIAFVAADLVPVVTLDVAPVSATGGRVTVRVSGEGRIAVAWADVDDTTTTIRAARIRCD